MAKRLTKNITGEVDVCASIAILAEQINEVKSGDLSCTEATLTAQANTLDLMFNRDFPLGRNQGE